MRKLIALLTLCTLSLSFGADLYTELLKEKVRSLPTEKAVKVGKGDKKLIIFVNPDCPHCREEWKHLREHLDKLSAYVFVLYFNSWGVKNRKKASYILCSKDKGKALDEVLLGKYDRGSIPDMSCPLVQEHIKAAELLGVDSVPYNIILDNFKVVQGYNERLLEYLGIHEGEAGKN